MNVAITGATGFVGRSLLDMAVARGIEVQALTRRPQEWRDGVKWIQGDLGNRRALSQFVKGAEAIIHVAGVLTAPDASGFENGNVIGTLNLIEAALKAGIPRLVVVSSLSAREPELSAYGASKLRAEKLVKASGLDWTIVRPPAVFGPRDDAMFDLFRAAKWGVVPIPGDGRASVIYVDDLCELLLALIPGGEEVTHRTFEPDDGIIGGWRTSDLAMAIGDAVGRRPRVVRLSRKVMNIASRADVFMRGTGAMLTKDRVGYLMHPDWVVSEDGRIDPAIWQARTDTRVGLRQTADWYLKHGWL